VLAIVGFVPSFRRTSRESSTSRRSCTCMARS
jgi:hypothetical protein